MALYCTLKALKGFSLHFPENRGGSDPSVKMLHFFLMKASLKNLDFALGDLLDCRHRDPPGDGGHDESLAQHSW